MSADSLKADFGRLDLASLAELPISKDFDRAIGEVFKAFDTDDIVRGRKTVKAEVTLKVAIELDVERGDGAAEMRVEHKLPKPRVVRRSVRVAGERIYVEQDDSDRQGQLIPLDRKHREHGGNRGQ